jgi:hypothetical protein
MQLTTKPNGDQFSVVENICHLRDIEIEGYAIRISRILNESLPTLPDIDGGRLALERDYNQQSVASALNDFRRARLENVALLKEVNQQEFGREGVLEGVGRISLEQLLHLMCEHDEGHVAELRTLRETLWATSASSVPR